MIPLGFFFLPFHIIGMRQSFPPSKRYINAIRQGKQALTLDTVMERNNLQMMPNDFLCTSLYFGKCTK